jgi:hypothetical protein
VARPAAHAEDVEAWLRWRIKSHTIRPDSQPTSRVRTVPWSAQLQRRRRLLFVPIFRIVSALKQPRSLDENLSLIISMGWSFDPTLGASSSAGERLVVFRSEFARRASFERSETRPAVSEPFPSENARKISRIIEMRNATYWSFHALKAARHLWT